MKYFKLIFRNSRRKPLRSLLTALVTMVLVLVVTLVWSILWLLDIVTAEKSQNFKAMVTERWAVPSRLPYAYADALSRGAAGTRRYAADGFDDLAILHRHARSGKLTRENMVFAIACEPDKDRHDDGGARHVAGQRTEAIVGRHRQTEGEPARDHPRQQPHLATNKRIGKR